MASKFKTYSQINLIFYYESVLLKLSVCSFRMPSAAVIAGTFAAVVAVFAGYIYLFGIPPELKRKMEQKALETMGEVCQTQQ